MDTLTAKDGTTIAIRDGEILEARDGRGAVFFEFDTLTGRGALKLPGLTITGTGKDAEIACERNLRIASGGQIEIASEEVRVEAGRFEQVLGRVFRWAKEVYDRVEGLHHSRAGRVRAESKGAYLVQSERARIEAVEDVRVQGKTISLG